MRRVKNKLEAPFQCRVLQEVNESFPAGVPQNSMADRQILQISEFHFGKVPHLRLPLLLHTFNVFMLEDKIQNPSKCLFRFSLGSHEMEVVGLVDGSTSSRSVWGSAHLPNFEMLDTRIASALKQDHPEFLLQKEKPVWRNRKLRKRIGSFAQGRSLVLMNTVLNFVFTKTTFRNFTRDGKKFYYL